MFGPYVCYRRRYMLILNCIFLLYKTLTTATAVNIVINKIIHLFVSVLKIFFHVAGHYGYFYDNTSRVSLKCNALWYFLKSLSIKTVLLFYKDSKMYPVILPLSHISGFQIGL